MPPDSVSELLAALDEATALLREANETHWVGWLERDRRLIANGDFYGVEHLLRAFGGMGSFNDYVLPDPEGNARLCFLRSIIYEHAASLEMDRRKEDHS